MEDEYNVTDYFLHDTKTLHDYDVVWAPGRKDLLVRVSHQATVSQLLQLLVEPTGAADERVFQLDLARTAPDFGIADHTDTVAVLLPSQDGPRSDKHAIAPSMAGALAVAFVNEACVRANDLQAAIDQGSFDNDGMRVCDRIDLYLEEAGFTVLSNYQGNLRIAEPWDAYDPEPTDEPESAQPLEVDPAEPGGALYRVSTEPSWAARNRTRKKNRERQCLPLFDLFSLDWALFPSPPRKQERAGSS